MKRIALILVRMFVFLPYYFTGLHTYQNKKYTLEERYAFIKKLINRIIISANVEITCTGIENLPEESGYLLASNHQGLFDPVIVAYTHPKPCTAVIKKELMKTPVVRQIALILDAIPMDRSNVRESVKVIRQVTKEIKAGRNFIIYPEGTRSKLGNQLLEFKAGTFKSVVDASKPIVPIAVIDSYKVFDTNSIKKVNTQIHYLPPIYPEEYSDFTSIELAKYVQDKIESKIKEVQNESV